MTVIRTRHAFFNDSRPDVYSREATADAWNQVLTLHLEENL